MGLGFSFGGSGYVSGLVATIFSNSSTEKVK